MFLKVEKVRAFSFFFFFFFFEGLLDECNWQDREDKMYEGIKTQTPLNPLNES